MAYVKQTWENSAATPLSSTRLNKLETQYDESIAEVVAQVGDATKPIGQALNTTFVAVRTSDGHPLPAGTIVVITLDKTLAQVTATPVADIADITFQTGA